MGLGEKLKRVLTDNPEREAHLAIDRTVTAAGDVSTKKQALVVAAAELAVAEDILNTARNHVAQTDALVHATPSDKTWYEEHADVPPLVDSGTKHETTGAGDTPSERQRRAVRQLTDPATLGKELLRTYAAADARLPDVARGLQARVDQAQENRPQPGTPEYARLQTDAVILGSLMGVAEARGLVDPIGWRTPEA